MLQGLGEGMFRASVSLSVWEDEKSPPAAIESCPWSRGSSGVFVEEQSWDPAPQPQWDQPGWGTGLSPAVLSFSIQGSGLKPAQAEPGQAGVAMGGDTGLRVVRVGTGHSQQGWMGKVLPGRD